MPSVACCQNWEHRETASVPRDQAVSPATKIPRIVHCILKFLFAPDVALSCLDRSMAKQQLNLFEFAPTTMAKARAGAAKVVWRQVVYSGLSGTPLHRVPDYVCSHI